MIDANIVIDVFNSVIDCLSSLLNTSVGGWIGACIILCYILYFARQMTKI